MKNLIVFEYFSSNFNLDINENKDILKEGLNIVNSLMTSLSGIQKKQIFILRSFNLPVLKVSNVNFLITEPKKDWIWHLKKFDPKQTELIIVAPEKSKINQNIFRLTRKMNFKIVGSDFNIIKIFSSKFQTYKYLNKFKIPCVKTTRNHADLDDSELITVMKPDMGGGSKNIFLLSSLNVPQTNLEKTSAVFQPFIDGITGSLNILCSNGKGKIIGFNKHITKNDGKSIKQVGSIIGGLENDKAELLQLSKKVCFNFPGLYGFIGIDIIKDKNLWKILEINPRFTSTYCGLHKSYGSIIHKFIKEFYIEKTDILKKNLELIKVTKLFF